MLAYGVIYFLMSINAFLNSKRTKHFSILFFLLFILFFSFRNNVGTDWLTYEFYFNNITDQFTLERYKFEYGFWLLTYLCSYLFDSYRYMVLILGLLTGILFWKATNKYTENIGLLFLLSIFYIFYPSLEAIRQSVTIILFYYSLQYIDDNKKKYIYLNIIGFLFHSTGIFSFIFLLFSINKRFKISIFLFLFLFSVLDPFIQQAISIFPSLSHRYYWYIQYIEHEEATLFSLKLFEYLLLLVFYFTLAFRKKLNKMENIAKNLIFIGFIAQISIGQISDMVYRMTYYTDIGVLFAYTFIYDKIKNSILKYFYIIFIILYVFVRLYRAFPFDDPRFIYSILG